MGLSVLSSDVILMSNSHSQPTREKGGFSVQGVHDRIEVEAERVDFNWRRIVGEF